MMKTSPWPLEVSPCFCWGSPRGFLGLTRGLLDHPVAYWTIPWPHRASPWPTGPPRGILGFLVTAQWRPCDHAASALCALIALFALFALYALFALCALFALYASFEWFALFAFK